MEIKLTEKEALEYFHNALCNGGIQELRCSGIKIEYAEKDYDEAKANLVKKQKTGEFEGDAICLEDVWMEILNIGKSLTFKDIESDGEYTRTITKHDIINKASKAPVYTIMQYYNEEDDAITAFNYIQAILYDGEIIFG